jgi:hypothetical protein
MSFDTFSTLASTSYLSPFGNSGMLCDLDQHMVQVADRRRMLEERDARGHRRRPAISIALMEEIESPLPPSSYALDDLIDVDQDLQSSHHIEFDSEDSDYFGYPNPLSRTSFPSPSIQCLVRNFSYSYAESDEAFRFTSSLSPSSPLSLSVCQALPVLGRRKIDAAFPVPPCTGATRRSYSDDDKENIAPRKYKGRRSGRISV